MNTKFFASILLVLFVGCVKNPEAFKPSTGQVTLTTDRTTYAILDTIQIRIENQSEDTITVGLRCSGAYLELFYQRKEDREWAPFQFFDYMSFRCPTLPHPIPPGTSYTHSLSAREFPYGGTYRLILPAYFHSVDSTRHIYSNAFEVQ